MSRSEQKVLQYLNEAHASEVALVRVLQSQIAMTPRGSYRTALETHLGETRRHADARGDPPRRAGPERQPADGVHRPGGDRFSRRRSR